MGVTINPISTIEARLGIDDNGKVQKFFTQNCYKHMDKYVPRRDGNLRTIVDLQSNSITYESPYAHYQYKGEREDGTHKVNPANYTTPGTGPYWDRRMVSAEIKDVIKETEKFIERG